MDDKSMMTRWSTMEKSAVRWSEKTVEVQVVGGLTELLAKPHVLAEPRPATWYIHADVPTLQVNREHRQNEAAIAIIQADDPDKMMFVYGTRVRGESKLIQLMNERDRPAGVRVSIYVEATGVIEVQTEAGGPFVSLDQARVSSRRKQDLRLGDIIERALREERIRHAEELKASPHYRGCR